jgi:hypothetical protein
MFLKKEIAVDDWEIVLSIIEEYGLDYLINVFDKLTKFEEYNYNFNKYVYARYGDQRSSESRFFNKNDELLRKLTKAKVSFNTMGGDIYYCPKKWIPFNHFLKKMRSEILTNEWTIEQYKTVLNELKKLHFNNININPNDWSYPHKYNTLLPYLLVNDDGAMAMRKIYSDAIISIEETNPSIEYSLPEKYPNVIWKYHLDNRYKREASWYSIVELEESFEKKIYASLYLRSLAIDITKVPKREEIESFNFDPIKIYNIKQKNK